MSVLYFQIPDPNPSTDGIQSNALKVHGANVATDLIKLRKLLDLAPAAGEIAIYERLTDLQRAHGLLSDGVVGPFMWQALSSAKKLVAAPPSSWQSKLTPDRIAKLFPFTQAKNIQLYAPYILAALDDAGYGPSAKDGSTMARMALVGRRILELGLLLLYDRKSRCKASKAKR